MRMTETLCVKGINAAIDGAALLALSVQLGFMAIPAALAHFGSATSFNALPTVETKTVEVAGGIEARATSLGVGTLGWAAARFADSAVDLLAGHATMIPQLQEL